MISQHEKRHTNNRSLLFRVHMNSILERQSSTLFGKMGGIYDG